MLWRYMVGAVAARTGDEMSGPALLVTGLAVTGSPVLASWLLAGLTISAAVGGPLLGVLLDRVRRPGRVLACCLAGYAGGLVCVLGGLGRVPDAALIGLAVAAGLLGPALTGGWTAQLPLVTGPERLGRATAFDSMSYNVAGLAGPAVAGVVATVSGGPVALLACVALLLMALPAAWHLPAARRRIRDDEVGRWRAVAWRGIRGDEVGRWRGAWRGIWGDLGAGFGVLVRSGALRRATVGSMVSCAGLAMMVVSAPVLGARLTGESGHGALLLAVTAACGLAVNGVVAAWGRVKRWDVVLAWGTAVLGAGMALAAFAQAFWVAVVAAGVAGVGEGPQLTALFAVRHQHAPTHLRGQVFTTGASLKITSFALGAALAGPLAAYSTGAALLTGAALQALAVAILIPRRAAT
ncbi:Major Facilitator Superfamily protein [Nonomuraea solani]|uniref:Major Facilitator Superfamily protein n=1 Tax=Nonomuraea solani TaxID=1144553 RepID=A0A1H6E1L0_9ACTN|nr:MFS transporter [Nonomuraea solani]SEG91452.1 Major Facilitator Superfamily protein [Nonomuraea solani]